LSHTNTLSTALGACHQGAATEGLCRTGERRNDTARTYTTFYQNVSYWGSDLPNAANRGGVLAYNLRIGGDMLVPSAMHISLDPLSNVGTPIFLPGWNRYSLVNFDECGGLYIEASQDDTVTPPSLYDPPLKVKNWYVCLSRWAYTYESLIWKVGLTGEPQNPSCQKVEVERVWVKEA
jgi:hypothetical protein